MAREGEKGLVITLTDTGNDIDDEGNAVDVDDPDYRDPRALRIVESLAGLNLPEEQKKAIFKTLMAAQVASDKALENGENKKEATKPVDAV